MSDIPALSPLGYSPRWQALFAQFKDTHVHSVCVVRTDRGSALIAAQDGLFRAKPSTALVKAARGPIDLPVVCDLSLTRHSRSVKSPDSD